MSEFFSLSTKKNLLIKLKTPKIASLHSLTLLVIMNMQADMIFTFLLKSMVMNDFAF